MKAISSAILLCLLPLALLRAEEAAKPEQELLPFQQEFLNLPQEKREEFEKKLAEAQRLFSQKRVFETLEKVAEASAIFSNSPDLVNLEGACQVEFRNFDNAMTLFKKADALAPNQPTIVFNIAELNFVTRNWAAAEETLNQVLKMSGETPVGNDLQLSRLVEFKLLLSKIKLGKTEEAEQLAAKYDYLDDSPFPYYAEAAMKFAANDEISAEAAMQRAGRIFQNPAVLAPWQDTMIEFGYIKGFFGGE